MTALSIRTIISFNALILALISSLPTSSCFVSPFSSRTRAKFHLPPRNGDSLTSLSLGIIDTDSIAIASQHMMTIQPPDIASFHPGPIVATPLPNQSLPPLLHTVPSGTIIPDQLSMPGGVPRSGNALVVESFQSLFGGPIRSNIPYNDGGDIYIQAKELDVVARYADLLNRIPLAAAVYALVDFFIVNAEEDVAVAELLNDVEEGGEIMEMETSVVKARFVGLFAMVVATVLVSCLVYHPVPFQEL